jgi:nicotinamidase-related amidase
MHSFLAGIYSSLYSTFILIFHIFHVESSLKSIALLIVDMQVGNFLEPNPVYKGDELLNKVDSLIKIARSAEIPVIYVQNLGGKGDPDEYGTRGYEIHPSIKPESSDYVVQKKGPDAFHETSLREILDSKGVEKLIVSGIQTEFCVDTTCRRAFTLGYNVILVGDAHSTWDSNVLTAQQIIKHHNNVLSGWFVKLLKMKDFTDSKIFFTPK